MELLLLGKENIYIIHCAISLDGGVGTVIKTLIENQISQGYKVGLAFIDNDSNRFSVEKYNNEINLFPLKIKKFKGSSLLFGLPMKNLFLREKKRKPKYKIILHAHNPAVLGALKNLGKLPLMCTIHGVNPKESYLTNKLTKLILKRMKFKKNPLIAVSEHTAIHYNADINSSYIKVIKNGVNIKETDRRDKEDYFTIGYTSYLDDLKGWRYIVDAYRLLLPKYKNSIRLVLAGNGPQSEIDKLNDIIKNDDLEHGITYLGFVSDASNQLMSAFDIFVLPSKSEGIPMAILEALGHSIPVLATPVGGIPEVIENGYNGFLLDRDPLMYSEKIIELYENKTLFNNMQKNAYQSYNSLFKSEIMANKYEAIYKKLINEKK